MVPSYLLHNHESVPEKTPSIRVILSPLFCKSAKAKLIGKPAPTLVLYRQCKLRSPRLLRSALYQEVGAVPAYLLALI